MRRYSLDGLERPCWDSAPPVPLDFVARAGAAASSDEPESRLPWPARIGYRGRPPPFDRSQRGIHSLKADGALMTKDLLRASLISCRRFRGDPTAAYPISEDTSIPPEERATLWIPATRNSTTGARRAARRATTTHTIHLDERTGAAPPPTVDGVPNPAFLRFHPKGVVYALTESIHENGEIVGFRPTRPAASSRLPPVGARAVDVLPPLTTNLEHVLFVNYWIVARRVPGGPTA